MRSYQANVWWLYHMIGKVEELTATSAGEVRYTVNDCSGFDLPQDARSAVCREYDAYIRLPDLGFRVIIGE